MPFGTCSLTIDIAQCAGTLSYSGSIEMRLRVACKEAAILLVVALMVAVIAAAPASAGESQWDEWTPCPPPPCDEWNPCPPPPPDNGGGNNGGNGPHKQRHN